MFRYPSPDLCLNKILSWSSKNNSFNFMAWFLLWHVLSTAGSYIDRWMPFLIISNQLNLPQVDSNQVVGTSRMINGNRINLSSISSLLAKSLNTYVNKVFLFLFFIHLQTFLKPCCSFVITGYWWGKHFFNTF
jgi:hypothetical protein